VLIRRTAVLSLISTGDRAVDMPGQKLLDTAGCIHDGDGYFLTGWYGKSSRPRLPRLQAFQSPPLRLMH
jgi:hypothetical protein